MMPYVLPIFQKPSNLQLNSVYKYVYVYIYIYSKATIAAVAQASACSRAHAGGLDIGYAICVTKHEALEAPSFVNRFRTVINFRVMNQDESR